MLFMYIAQFSNTAHTPMVPKGMSQYEGFSLSRGKQICIKYQYS